MTAERHDGTPAPRPRAGQRRPLRAAVTATATRPVTEALAPAPETLEPASAPTPATTAGKPDKRPNKYTVLLDDRTAVAFDELALVARRKLGRRVDKSALLRALILLAADDASLRDQVIDHVGKVE